MPCLFHLASYFQVSSVLLHVSELNFFLCLNNIPSYGYTTFFIHSSVDWPLSYFHLWALVNYASMNTGITSIHSSPCFQLLWVFMGGVELLDHMVILCLAFWGTTKHFFFLTTAPFYSPTICICICIHICPLYIYVQGYQFFHIFTNTCYFPYFYYNHAHWYEVGSLWFWFSFP